MVKNNGDVNMKKKGIALIVVLVVIMMFLSIILIVVISATNGIRNAHYYSDKTLALQIADAGIQDCLYWMNYKGYDTYKYPDDNTYFKGSDYTEPETPWTSTEPKVTDPHPYKPIKGLQKPNFCKLEFKDGTDTDTIISTGYYNGRTAKITVNIRGNNGNGNDTHNNGGRYLRDFLDDGTTSGGVATWGIPEAFNKHTIYATSIGSNPTTTVKGNITTTTPKPGSLPGTDATWTETDNVSLPILSVKPSAVISPPRPDDDNYDDIYDDSGNREGDGHVNLIPNDGVYFDGSTYYFGTDDGTRTDTNYYNIFPLPESRSTHSVKIEGAKAVLTNGVEIKNYFYCDDEVRVETAIFSENNTAIEANKITLSSNMEIGKKGQDYCLIVKPLTSTSLNIESDVKINGDFGIDLLNLHTLNINATNLKINGCLFTNGSLTIDGSIEIDASSSGKIAGILLYSNTDKTLDLTINSSTEITTGENQIAGIMVYFDPPKPKYEGWTGGKISNIKIYAPLSDNSGTDTQFLIVNQSDGGSIVINIPSDSKINGSIYSAYYYSNPYEEPPPVTPPDPPPININSGTIKGSIITNGTVNLNGGSVIYNSKPYKNGKGDIYRGFVGGRRVYVPVPGSWKVEW